jgi:hypothetical protein
VNAILPFVPFLLLFAGVRCLLGMWETGRRRDWEGFARWSIGMFVTGLAVAGVSMLLDA